jgi:hypothetical protein
MVRFYRLAIQSIISAELRSADFPLSEASVVRTGFSPFGAGGGDLRLGEASTLPSSGVFGHREPIKGERFLVF